MTDTDRMVAWLREAMDAAQRDAEAATPGPWAADFSRRSKIVKDGDPVLTTTAIPVGPAFLSEHAAYSAANARHITRHDPAAVLRRIAANRKTLDDCDDVLHDFVFGAFRQLAYDTVRNLAVGYGWTDKCEPSATS